MKKITRVVTGRPQLEALPLSWRSTTIPAVIRFPGYYPLPELTTLAELLTPGYNDSIPAAFGVKENHPSARTQYSRYTRL
jgi:hypothetical protein